MSLSAVERDPFFTLSLDLLCVANAAGYFLRVNPAFTRSLGWSADELTRRPLIEFVHPEDREATLREIERQVTAGQQTLRFENRYRHRDGSWRRLSWTSTPQPGGLMYASARDVTDLWLSEAALRESERRTAELLKDLTDIRSALDEHAIVTLTDPRGRMTWVNDRFCQIFGYSREELTGRNHRIVNSGHHPPAFFADLWATIQRGRVWKGEVCNRSKDGRVGWYDTTIVPFLAADGSPQQFVSIQTDISSRKRAEEEIRQFNAELEALVEARTAEVREALDAVEAQRAQLEKQGQALETEKVFSETVIESVSGLFYVLDAGGCLVRWNRAMRDLFGLTDDDMAGLPALARVHEADHDLVARKIGEAFTAGYAEVEVRILAWDGERHALLTGRRMVLDEAVYLVGAGVDITARKQAEAALLESDRFAHASLDALGARVAILDARGAILAANQAWTDFAQQHGLPADAVGPGADYLAACELGRSAAGPMGPRLAEGIRSVSERTAAAFTFEYPHRTASERSWFLCRVTRFPGDGPVRVAVAHEDVTAIKHAEDAIRALNADLERRIVERTAQLETALEAADAASRAKSAFLANMSHEIRTPLNAIAGMVELLEHTADASERAKMLRVTQESTRALAEIINDVLDLSKIEAGKVEAVLAPTSLRQVVSSVVDLFSHPASEKGLTLETRVADDVPAAVQCDALRLRQILFNLVGNAIKFTATGGIEVRVSCVEAIAEAAVVRLEVEDTGIGISREAQTRLFQPFVQAEVDTTRKFGGSGLGLAISQRLARLLGGALELDSEEGRGTTLTLTLTLALASADDVPSPEVRTDPAASGRRSAPDSGRATGTVLIVDDSAVNRQVLRHQLRTFGYAVDEASNGREGLDAWRARPYALIICDCHMPEMDGYEMSGRIRREEAGGRHTPIVGYTANAGKESRDLCLAAGMDDALIKPVTLEAVGGAVGRWAVAPSGPCPIDWAGLAEITGGDDEFARELVAGFAGEPATDVRTLAAQLATRPLDEVRALAHRLKGTARTVAATDLAALLARIETAARAGDRRAVSVARTDLDRELARVLDYVAAEVVSDGAL